MHNDTHIIRTNKAKIRKTKKNLEDLINFLKDNCHLKGHQG